MGKLKEYFESSEKVICSVVAEIERLKMPETDKAFVSFVEKLESGDRDLTALNLLGQVANESHMFKLVEKLPGLGKLVTGRTLTASATHRDDSPKPSFKFKCRVRRKERNQITKWEAVRTGELCRTKRGEDW